MALKYILPALAAASGAAAACSGTSTIQNSGDASALSTCLTFSGSIAIATATSDDIALNGIRRITGSLSAKDVHNLGSLSGDSLLQIDDSFSLNNMSTLATLDFPQLSDVDTVDWVGLPNLDSLSFETGLSTVSSLSIQNTQLGSLDGIDLDEVDTFIVANNNYLTSITMKLTHVGTALSLEANGRDVAVSFPSMIWANNMTFRNCSSVNIPQLGSLNGSLGFYSNYFDSISAPNLTTVGASLAFVSNMDVTNISFPELNTVNGGLQVANNTQLGSIDGFGRLSRVGGAIDFNGEFSQVTLPKLSDVRGAFNLQSTKDISAACDHFKPLSGSNNVIRGSYTCAGKVNKPGGTGTLKPGTNAGGGGSSTSSGAASPMLIPGATGLLGLLAAIFGML